MPWKWTQNAQGWHSRTWVNPAQAASKKAAKSKGVSNTKGTLRQCTHASCFAAQNKQATWGGASCCHVCKEPFSKPPPVEKLVQWAYLEAVEQAKVKKAEAAKAAGTSGNTPQTADELQLLRKTRLQELKAVASSDDTSATMPTQELARVFIEPKTEVRKVQLDSEVATLAQNFEKRFGAVLDSMQAESLPATTELLSPEEVLNKLLHSSSECKTDLGMSNADQALATTQAALAAMRSGGVQESDELLGLMLAREKKQAAEAKKLKDKAPSQELKSKAMASLRQNYEKTLQQQADARTKGEEKANERAAEREKVASELLAAAQKLVTEVESSRKELSTAHADRAELKRLQGVAVLELIDQKTAEISAENVDVVFQDIEDELDPVTTETENERDEALRLADLLDKQLKQFKQIAEQTAAAEASSASAAPQAEANPTADLWLDFAAEPSQLPTLGTPSPEAVKTLHKLAALFAAVPWGTQLPALQFEHLGVRPSFVHTMVGNTIWNACWGERQGEINLKHWIPYKLLNIAKTVVEQYKYQLEEQLIEEGKQKYAEVESAAIKRRKTSATP